MSGFNLTLSKLAFQNKLRYGNTCNIDKIYSIETHQYADTQKESTHC